LSKISDAEAAIAAILLEEHSIFIISCLELIEEVRDKVELKYLAA
jgi:hypothetical protein